MQTRSQSRTRKLIRWMFPLLFLFTHPGKAQENALQQPVTLTLSNSSLDAVVASVAKQSSLTFSYDRSQLAGIKVEKVNWHGTSLKNVLTELNTRTGLEYAVSNGTLAIRIGQRREKPQAGKITGKVIDEDNGDPVIGATIRIADKGTVTDISGAFSFTLPSGTYKAIITSTGYATKEVTDIEVKEGRNFEMNITLKRKKGQLSTVVITASAKKETVASLYARQKAAPGITDGISAEQIARTPDKNIGESLKRISGLSTMENKYVVVRGLSERYNQAILNGQPLPSTELNRKQFSFDIIPSNMVDNVIVSKTLTPDKSAEFGGGLVEVNTKDIPSENFLSLTAGVTVSDLTSGKKMLSLKREGNKGYFADFAEHRYMFGQKNWNSLKDIRDYQFQHRNEVVMSNNWQPYYYNSLPSQNYQLSLGRVKTLNEEKQNKIGVMASVSYRNTQNIQQLETTRHGYGEGDVSAGLRGDQYAFSTSLGGLLGIGYTTKKHKLNWQNVFTRLLDEQMIYGIGYNEFLLKDTRSIIEKVNQTSLWQSQLRGEHALGNKGIKVNWTGSYTYVKRSRPDNHILTWKEPEGFEVPNQEFLVAEWYPTGGAGSANDPAALRMYSDAIENNFSWDANIQLPFNISITRNTLKAGYAGWVKDRKFFVAMMGYHPGRYDTYPSLGTLFTESNGGGRSTVGTFGDDYNRKAPLHALYGMFDNRIGKHLRLVWGLRAEYFDMDKSNQAIDGNIAEVSNGTTLDDFSALRNQQKNWQLFPSANITYSITPKMNVRAAYSKSIIRPDLREMAYFREYDFELGGIYQADFLKATIMRNYDLRFEWYPGAGEVLSASAFYKEADFPMEIYKNLNTYNLQNNFKSNTRGLELEARKSLSFINVPVIKRLTLYGNFTVLTSHITPMQVKIGAGDATNPYKLTYVMIPGREEHRPLSGQSNFMGNAGMYYDDEHLHLSLSYNSVSNRMLLTNVNFYGWQFEKPIRSLDGQISYRFFDKRAEVKLNISNLLNESTIIYANNGTKEEAEAASKGNYTQHYLLYDEKKDILLQRTTPGRSYGLSISYNFK